MKRFYKLVFIKNTNDGYHILLDGRPVKTKSGAFLCAKNDGIATRIMQEWAEQDKDIIPDTMPFTQILNTKIDRVSKERAVMSSAILKYLDTDLICYMASEPERLVSLQRDKWQIWLNWFQETFGHELQTTTSLLALKQSAPAHDVVAKYVKGLDDDRFTILQIITSVSGSLILALALVQGGANARQVFDACFVEEDFKSTLYDADKYGVDPLLEKTQKAAMQDFISAQDYISLL